MASSLNSCWFSLKLNPKKTHPQFEIKLFGLGFCFNSNVKNKTASYKTVAAQLPASIDAVSKFTSIPMQTVSKLMWKPNFFPAQACRRATCSRWKTKTSLPAHCQKPVVMETSSCFHVRNFGQTKNAQNQSASPKTHSRLHTVVLVWNKTCFTDFKPASTQTVCHIHDVILYDITCLVHPNASWWPLERKTNEFLWWLCHSAWKSLICTTVLTFMVYMSISGPNCPGCFQSHVLATVQDGTPNFHTPFQAHVISSLTSSAFQVVTTLNST